ncbi:Calcium-binding protein SPEC 2C [Echinococcus granulosus]|uniref:Calcium-binding protein SPEC 2C n=4 Tax=Echinococcus granulosus TaxID=6210 RepID=W6UZX2_ECHGR|nr:Calcium-binding protein SPEC 2C [Echinococcus granulosus]EUB64112.1 Calcium-binding protein SPEC 2C [Echinococcus granulosus]QBL95743.1 EpC1 [Echinococcus granulosus]
MSLQKTVEKLFDELDKDKSGKISCAELKSALQSCSAEPLDDDHVKAFLDKLDSNKDGELSLDELMALF